MISKAKPSIPRIRNIPQPQGTDFHRLSKTAGIKGGNRRQKSLRDEEVQSLVAMAYGNAMMSLEQQKDHGLPKAQ